MQIVVLNVKCVAATEKKKKMKIPQKIKTRTATWSSNSLSGICLKEWIMFYVFTYCLSDPNKVEDNFNFKTNALSTK